MTLVIPTQRAVRKIDVTVETFGKPSLFVNPIFQDDFKGWITDGTVSIDDKISLWGSKSCKFYAKQGGMVGQIFPDPIRMREIDLWTGWFRASDTGLFMEIILYCSDGTAWTLPLTPLASANTWDLVDLKSLPLPDVTVEGIFFDHVYTYANHVWMNGIFMSLRNLLDLPSTLRAGEKVVASAGTPEALGSALVFNSILVQAKSSNTGKVYVGNSTTQNVELEAGDVVIVVIDNLSKVYVKVAVNGEGVNYVGS